MFLAVDQSGSCCLLLMSEGGRDKEQAGEELSREAPVYKRRGKGSFSHSVSYWQPDHWRNKMANIVTSTLSVAILVTLGQARAISKRQLDSLGGNQLLGRAVLDLEPQDFQTSYIQEKDFERSLDTLGGGNILRSRSLDTLGGESILRSRSLDTLGGDSILRSRSLDTLGGDSILRSRSLDTLGGDSILRSRSLDTLGGGNILRSRTLDTLGGDSILRSRSLDTLGGGNILRSRSSGSIESPTRMGDERNQGYYPPLDTLGGGNLF